MKSKLLVLLLFCSNLGWADETSISRIQIEEKPAEPSSAYGQLFTLQLASFEPESLQVDNGSYTFNYGGFESTLAKSYLVELGWAPRLFEWWGAFYLEEQLAFSSFSGGVALVSDLPPLTSTSYSLYLFGLDSRLLYAGTWFPWKRLLPIAEGGYLYSIFYQPGASGFESVQGGVGNFVAGAGVRFWLNRDSALNGSAPFFLTVKWNRIFSRPGDVNLGSASIMGGISVGL